MADTTAKLILYRLNETLTNMADTILSFFYVDESKETLDVVNMLFVGWILLGILVYFLGTFIASQLESVRENAPVEPSKSPSEESNEELSKSDEKNGGQAKPSKRISTGAADVVVGAVEESIVASSVSNVLGAPRVGPLAHVPIATGNDAGSVRWINNILIWFNSTAKIPILIDCWVHSLNEQAAKLTTENGIQVEFDKVGEGCPKPELRDVQVSAESNNNVTVNCKVLAKQLLLHLLATRTMGKSKTSTDYQLLLERLDGKLKVTCNTEDKLLVVKFVEKPDVQLNLKLSKSGALKESALDQRALEDAIVDVAIQALTNAIVDFHLSQDPDFPNYVKDKASISPSSFSSATDLEQAVARHEQRLFVKVIKASHLGGEKGCQEAYCIVEMDDPAQKFQTASIKATNSPFWDEHFLFNLKSTSAEVLFEIYDKGKKVGENFMGLGIVSVEELLKNPSQRQIISLQSRPLENDKVTGSLTAEFLFMEGSEVPIRQQPGRTVETNSRVTSGGKIITTTTIKKSTEEDTGTVDDSVPLTDTALKEIEHMGKTGMSTNKSTLIIHSVQRELVRPTVKVKLDKDGRWHEVPATQTNGGDESGSGSPSSPTSKKPPSVAESASSTSDKDDRSARTKERKSFMGTLRKRLSFKKNRSKSVDPNGVDGQESSSGRSVSGDRSKSVPGSREQSQGRQPSHLGVPGGGSTRSSISEGSGFSGASSRTYINENSTLVIEINENGITKHYLIPFSLASRSKWRKRGLKLHIYNDHTFVAKHISGSVICQVCTRHFPRRPGKQAYSCRDCDLQCHKTCHVKVDSRCPNSTIHSLEMEYVQDPRIKSTSS